MSPETQQAINDLAAMLATFEQVSGHGTDAYTTRELQAVLNCGERRCQTLLRSALDAGKVRVCRKRITDMVGRPQTVPAYELVK